MTRKAKPNIMVFADGSYCSDTNAAGYGAWVKLDGIPSRVEGGYLREASTAFEAEALAILKAVQLAIWVKREAQGKVHPCNVMIQSDCIGVLEQLRTQIPGSLCAKHKDGLKVNVLKCKTHPLIKQVANQINILREGDQVSFRHVKGHSSEAEGRYWVNRRCDSLARKGMEAVRRERTVKGSLESVT